MDDTRHGARRGGLLRLAFAGVALLALAGVLAGPAPRAIAPVDDAPAAAFTPQQVRHGRELAAIGDCASCHTVRGSPSYAGGVPIRTPFGVVHGTNITPDRETGIGAWSEEAFRRALREGISRDGHHLYPAFPYNHFTHLADADIADLYAFLMTRDPVRAQAPANQLMFPFNFRPLVAFWNIMYLREGPRPATPGTAQQQRGAYLVDALAHCAACHSPHTRLGGERGGAFLAGGEAEGWHATALAANSPSPVPWDAASLAAYLRTGLVPDHAMTAGPMQEVVSSLSQADEQDIAAIAGYVASVMGGSDEARRAREADARRKAQSPLASLPPRDAADANDPVLQLGRAVYEGSCASCHDAGRGLSSNAALQLPLAVALHLPDPRNLVHIIREGIVPPEGEPRRWMPPFAGNLSDDEIAALVTWLRRQGTNEPPWRDVPQIVQQTGSAP